MKTLVVLLAIVLAGNAVLVTEVPEDQWIAFKLAHTKQYENEVEENTRKEIFRDNLNKIAAHNQNYEKGLVSYKLNMNQYGDLLTHEFKRIVNGFIMCKPDDKDCLDKYVSSGVVYIPPEHVELPASVDWRTKGAVTEVKDQGQCGSCWSFSTTGSLEGQHFRKSKKLVSLSEQNLIDCSQNYGNNGCNGGLMTKAFIYIKDNQGIDTEIAYPYEAVNNECRYNLLNAEATNHGFVNIESGNEEYLKAAVATIGPISVAIDASHDSFQFYSGGIYVEPLCSSDQLDHAVLVVGYGTNDKGVDFWIVKNSWGEMWGDNGYVMIARNKGNHCGIATQASYPLV